MNSKQNIAISEAISIINGFLNKFEGPSCSEQQDVVDSAKLWIARNTSESDKASFHLAVYQKDSELASVAYSFLPKVDLENPAPAHVFGGLMVDFVEELRKQLEAADENNSSLHSGSN